MKILKKILKWFILLFPLLLIIYAQLLNFGFLNIFSKNQPFELIADMDHEKIITPQKPDYFFQNGLSTLRPPDSTLPVNGSKYRYHQTEFDKADSTYHDPLPNTELILFFGKTRFETFCIYCHNYDGRGNGDVITKVPLNKDEEGFPGPPSLLRKETRAYSDARLFHIISSGQNLMSPVSDRLSESDRWALVHYIRYLQSTSKLN